jgi:DnaJ family protein C protein 19
MLKSQLFVIFFTTVHACMVLFLGIIRGFGSVLIYNYKAPKWISTVGDKVKGPSADVTLQKGGGWLSGLLSPGAFYQGGFDETMTKREAALVLGIRESAPRDKVKEAHRYMSRANHPDTGGSEYLAMKINEAKDLMLNSK